MLEIVISTIIASIVLFFILPLFKKPRDKFTNYIQQIFTHKTQKKEVIINKENREIKLKQLSQRKFEKGREIIDGEINNTILDVIEKYSVGGILYSSSFFNKALELHSVRILRFCELEKTIYKQIILDNKAIQSNEEIEQIMNNLEEMARKMALIIIKCAHILDNMNKKNEFIEAISWKVEGILSNIRRDLLIEKDENLLLKEN